MARLLVLYNPPESQAAFEKHYFEIHAGLAKKFPGVRSYTVSRGPVMRVSGRPGPYSFIAELTFDSVDDIRAALAGPEGQASGADMPNFAGAGYTVLMYESDEV